MIVAVLGASPKKERYSNKAICMLLKHNHHVIPVAPGHKEIEGLKAVPSLTDIAQKIDTLSVYVGPDRIGPLINDIVNLHPKRVILNPGTESSELIKKLKEISIPYIEACTLVLL